MEIYRVPCREVPARILVDDGRTLDGKLFTAETGAAGRPEDVMSHLNDSGEDFLPVLCGADSLLVNKQGILWVQLTGPLAGELVDEIGSGQRVPVRVSLVGGISVVGTLIVVMPLERSRVVDYLNASGRFLPVFGDGTVTLVHRRFVVTVTTGERDEQD